MRKADLWFLVGVALILLAILMFWGVVRAAPSYSNVGQNLTYVGMNGSIELRAKWTPEDVSYDVSVATYINSMSLSDSYPAGIAFNDDGTKMYVVGFYYDRVYEYSLSTPYDISTAVYNDYLDVSAQDGTPEGLAFNNDGTKLYVVGSQNDRVYEYNLSTPYDISTAVYNDNLSVSSQDVAPTDLAFNNNGTKLYIVGDGNNRIFEYTLSTPYDISTAVYNDYLDVSAQDGTVQSMAFNDDGTKLYVLGSDTDKLYEYNLSTPYDISTAVYNDYLDVYGTSEEAVPRGMTFNNDGTKLYIVGSGLVKVLEYEMLDRLDTAILYINISGSFQVVGTIDLNDSATATWSNFSYTPTTCNKVVGWKITANDSLGESNTTPIGTFYVMPYLYSTSDSSIISSIASCSSKHNATITPTGSGDVNLTLYMPYIVRNATFKECNYEVTEDADLVKIVPSTYYCVVNVTNLEAESGTSFYVKESTGLKAYPPSNLPAAVASAGLVIIIIYTIATRKRS